MANSLKFFISTENQRLLASPGAFNSASDPVFFAGNKVQVELHLYQGIGIARAPYEVPFPAGSTVNFAVGSIASLPTSGQWKLSVSSVETANLDFDATAGEVQTALNAIAPVSSAGGVSVISLGDGYSITWNTVGTKPSILAGPDTLVPSSYQSIYILQAGSATEREIVFVELRQTPVALATTFSPIGAPVVSVTTVSAWNGSNKVVRVGIDPAPQGGSYTLNFDGDTAVITAGSGPADIRTALISAGITAIGPITQTGLYQHDIVFTADHAVTVNGSGLIQSMGVVGEVDLATSEMLAFLGSEPSKAAHLEITVTASGDEQTVCQVDCTVANGVVAPGAVSPVPIGVILTEAIANDRFVRRDAAQSPAPGDLDIIWPNLGVSLDGSDVAAAISGSVSPSSGNVFVTMSERNPFDQSLDTTSSVTFSNVTLGMGGVLTFGDSTTLSTAPVTFDQSLNTTDSVTFRGLILNDNAATYDFRWSAAAAVAGVYAGATPIVEITTNGIVFGSVGASLTFSDSTIQETALPNGSTWGGGELFPPVWNATTEKYEEGVGGYNFYFDQAGSYIGYVRSNTGPNSTGSIILSEDGGTTTTELFAQGIKFADGTSQITRVVREDQANGSGYGTGGFDTVHYPYEVKVIDDAGVAYWVPARLA